MLSLFSQTQTLSYVALCCCDDALLDDALLDDALLDDALLDDALYEWVMDFLWYLSDL